MTVMTYTDELQVIECGTCHVSFAIPTGMYRDLVRTQEWLWCPRGCRIHYYGKTEATKLREQLETARESESWWRDRAAAARREAENQRRLAVAYKGHLTRMRHRVARGVCPAGGCKRAFSDLHDHVATCHPELLGVLDEDQS